MRLKKESRERGEKSRLHRIKRNELPQKEHYSRWYKGNKRDQLIKLFFYY